MRDLTMTDDVTLDEWLEAQTEAINDQYEDEDNEYQQED